MKVTYIEFQRGDMGSNGLDVVVRVSNEPIAPLSTWTYVKAFVELADYEKLDEVLVDLFERLKER